MHFNHYFKNEFSLNFKELYKLSSHILGKVAIIWIVLLIVGLFFSLGVFFFPLVWEGLFIKDEVSFRLNSL